MTNLGRRNTIWEKRKAKELDQLCQDAYDSHLAEDLDFQLVEDLGPSWTGTRLSSSTQSSLNDIL